MDKNIKYDKIYNIGIELLRKNNELFYKSNLSHIMAKIFIASNRIYGITSIEDEYYMKSGAIPNRVYYIYTDRLVSDEKKSIRKKMYDVVNFNGEKCIWLYSKNIIDSMGEAPVNTILELYNELLETFYPTSVKVRTPMTFDSMENIIIKYAMTVKLIHFLYESYGLIDIDVCKNFLAQKMNSDFRCTAESAIEFINDTIDNTNKEYFFDRDYLDSYMLLKEKKFNPIAE